MFERILVPVDGSPTSNKALTQALQLARERGGTVRLMHSIDELMYGEMYGLNPNVMNTLREGAVKILADALEIAKAAGVEADTRLVDEPAQRLGVSVCKEAEQWRADSIVVGTHGRRGLSRLVLGSGADQIIRASTLPVLTIRGDDET